MTDTLHKQFHLPFQFNFHSVFVEMIKRFVHTLPYQLALQPDMSSIICLQRCLSLTRECHPVTLIVRRSLVTPSIQRILGLTLLVVLQTFALRFFFGIRESSVCYTFPNDWILRHLLNLIICRMSFISWFYLITVSHLHKSSLLLLFPIYEVFCLLLSASLSQQFIFQQIYISIIYFKPRLHPLFYRRWNTGLHFLYDFRDI